MAHRRHIVVTFDEIGGYRTNFNLDRVFIIDLAPNADANVDGIILRSLS